MPLPHVFRITFNAAETSRLTRPNTLALRAAQRQAAASRSTRPKRSVQQEELAGVPIIMLPKLSITFEQLPNLRGFTEHTTLESCGDDGGGQIPLWQVELTMVHNTKLKDRKTAMDS